MELPRKPNSNKSSPNFPSQTGTISSRTSTHGWSLFTSNVGAKSKNIYIRIFLLLGMTIIIKSGSYAIIYVSSVPDIESPSHPLSRRPRCLRCEICKQCRSAGSSLKVILEVFYALFLLKVPFRRRRWRRSSEGEWEEICPLTIKVSLYWLPLIPHHHRNDTLSIFQRYSLFKRNDMIRIHQSSNVFTI